MYTQEQLNDSLKLQQLVFTKLSKSLITEEEALYAIKSTNIPDFAKAQISAMIMKTYWPGFNRKIVMNYIERFVPMRIKGSQKNMTYNKRLVGLIEMAIDNFNDHHIHDHSSMLSQEDKETIADNLTRISRLLYKYVTRIR